MAGSDETFETAHRVLDALFRLIDVTYSLEEVESNYLIPGRSASILVDGKAVGIIGELKIEILERNGIIVPISAFEVDLTKVPQLKIQEFRTNTY